MRFHTNMTNVWQSMELAVPLIPIPAVTVAISMLRKTLWDTIGAITDGNMTDRMKIANVRRSPATILFITEMER